LARWRQIAAWTLSAIRPDISPADHPSDDGDVAAGVAAQRRGSPAEHGIDISHETVGLVESFWRDARRRDPQKMRRTHARLSSVVMKLLKRITR
jgi:hypothetical protein